MKKVVAMLLTVLLVVGLFAGCSSDSTEGDAAKDSSKESNGSTSKSDSGSSESTSSDEIVDITMMANLYQAELGRADKAFIEDLRENVGVNLEIEIPPSSGYAEKLQLMLVSGDYPDVVMFQSTNSDAYINAVEGGILLPLNDLLESAPDLVNHTYDASWKALTEEDGTIYGVPRTSVSRADGFYFRKDWLDKLGLSIPADGELTLDEFTAIITAFAKDDPDGNGVNDTYGLSSAVNANKVMNPVLSAQFGSYGWQESNGVYINAEFNKDTTVYKEILTYTRNLYLDGILHPNSAVNDAQAGREAFYAGQTGVLPGFAGKFSNQLISLQEVSPEGELVYGFVKNQEDEVKGAAFGTGMWQYWCITTACENPEKVIELMNYTLSDEGYDKLYAGVEGVSYNVVDGERVYVDDINEQKEAFVGLFLRRAGDANFFITPWSPADQVELTLPLLKKSVDSAVRSLDGGYVPSVAMEPGYMDYQTAYAEGLMKILLGDADVDSYDELLAGWYDNGGEEFVKEMNEFINK